MADDRLDKKARVLALTGSDETVAVVRDAVAEQGVLPFTLDDRRLVAVHVKGQASSLDDITVAGGAEIGSVAVFQPIADGRELTLTQGSRMGLSSAMLPG